MVVGGILWEVYFTLAIRKVNSNPDKNPFLQWIAGPTKCVGFGTQLMGVANQHMIRFKAHSVTWDI